MHLGELADVICGPFGSAITNKDYQESGIPLIRITNISGDGYMDYSDIIYISEELGNSLSRTQVSAGDIVISQRGSLGQCAIVDDTFPKLNISANIIDNTLCVKMKNKGKTIAKEDLGKIFGKFNRLDSARQSDNAGAGLGLSIAKEIINLHGGNIMAESSNNEITFHVEIPLE